MTRALLQGTAVAMFSALSTLAQIRRTAAKAVRRHCGYKAIWEWIDDLGQKALARFEVRAAATDVRIVRRANPYISHHR